ncbi:FAD-dependent oxidoreductase [Acidiferrobacter sp.]|uniref:FAD-dependent oxidoreductase n=1 Tax=Acidiferrobacter sp. TaxID=1872107 RepID=UPI002613181F|nr:FAD-dependent oxidoreductase [Acidiferrobacter sp.]
MHWRRARYTPGLADTPYWTSTDALAVTETPQWLLILGASVIAVELAQAFRRLGSEVTILARGHLLSRKDADLGRACRRSSRRKGYTS